MYGNKYGRRPHSPFHDNAFSSLSPKMFSDNKPYLPHIPQSRQDDDADFLEWLQSVNTQSYQVNSGNNSAGRLQSETPSVISAFTSPNYLTDIESSAYTVALSPFQAGAVAVQLIQCLMNPPPDAFEYGTLSIYWVVSAIGHHHFTFDEENERIVLAKDSAIRHYGRGLGLPAAYYEWLCGDNSELTAAEEGILLIPDFFEKEI